MILDTKVRSKINNIFSNHNPLEKYSVKIYKIDTFMSNMKNIYKLMIISVNTYYLKLIFVLVNIL